jgi:CheY-like chemotaxis protein
VFDARQARRRDVSAGEYVCLRVSDTGVGMPPSVQARAFDPFYTTKPIGKGAGLGLSMIYGFVRQSDGSVLIDSAPGKGTSIEICLPRYRGDAAGAPVQEFSGDNRAEANEVVLIVEDEAVVRLLIVETLNDLGYKALETADSAAALRILQSSQRVDLLVSDIGLPGLNGRQLADAARHAPGSEDPVRDRIRRRRRRKRVPGARDGDCHQALHDGGAREQDPRDDRGRLGQENRSVDKAQPSRPVAC